MDIYQEIQDRLKNERDKGATQNEMSNRTGLGQSHISRLLDSKRGSDQMKRLGLETFFKLFPNARIDFGDGVSAGGNRSVNNCNLNNSKVVTGDGTQEGTIESAASLLRRLMSSKELDAETKVKIYNIANQEN